MDVVLRSITGEANIYPELAASIFGLVLSICLAVKKGNSLRSFRALVYLLTAADIIDIVTIYIVKVSALPDFCLQLAETVNFYCFAPITLCLFYYLTSYMRPSPDLAGGKKVVLTLFSADTVCHVLNLFLPVIVSFDREGGHTVQGPLFYFCGFILPLLIVTVSLVLLILHRKEFSDRQILTISAAYILTLLGSVIQAFTGSAFCISYATGILAVYVLYFTTESPDYRAMADLIRQYEEKKQVTLKARREREDLFHGMTHEIRTPLNAIVGMGQMIRMDAEEPEVEEAAGRVIERSEKVLSVVNRVLGEAETEAHREKGPVTIPDLKGKRILSLDDTPMNLRVLEGLIGKTGAVVSSFTDGETALKALSGETYDLILTDHEMPGMDGTEFLRRVRAGGGGPTVVNVTGNEGEDHRKSYEKSGAAGILLKPVRAESLYRLLEDLL